MLTLHSIIFGFLVLALAPALDGQQQKPRSVVLPESAAEQVKQLCSRPGPPKFEGTWKPSDPDIQLMESRLSRISRLRTKSGLRVERPSRYYRQYVGIIVNKRKLIYINAFCEDSPPTNWQEYVIDVCDGGCSWGVVYDVARGAFSDLDMNGVA